MATDVRHALLRHCDELLGALGPFRRDAGETAPRWGTELLRVLSGGGRLLAAGNGGSAAQAQHLTAELVGRYREDRAPFSALALHADTSSTTAIANDYGADEVFARQVRAHGRSGDVLMPLSTSGASANLLAAARAARRSGLRVWALTGPSPNPLAAAADEALCVPGGTTATIQELHLVAVHLLCTAFDAALTEHGLPAGHGLPDSGPTRHGLPAEAPPLSEDVRAEGEVPPPERELREPRGLRGTTYEPRRPAGRGRAESGASAERRTPAEHRTPADQPPPDEDAPPGGEVPTTERELRQVRHTAHEPRRTEDRGRGRGRGPGREEPGRGDGWAGPAEGGGAHV